MNDFFTLSVIAGVMTTLTICGILAFIGWYRSGLSIPKSDIPIGRVDCITEDKRGVIVTGTLSEEGRKHLESMGGPIFEPPKMALDSIPAQKTGWQQQPGCLHLGFLGAVMTIGGHREGHVWVCQCGKRYTLRRNSEGRLVFME